MQVSLANQEVKYDLIAQEVKSTEHRRGASSTYTKRTRIRGVVLHMLGGQEKCTGGAMIYKAAVRRYGHNRCTSAGTDARVGGTVRMRVRHVIDRGRGAPSARHLVLALVSEGKSNSRLLQEVKGRCS